MSDAIRRYQEVMAEIQRMEGEDLERAREPIEAALGRLERRLEAVMAEELAAFEKEHGFQPAEVSVSMLPDQTLGESWPRYRLRGVTCAY